MEEATLLKAPQIIVKEYLSTKNIAGLLESPVEIIAFCEEEGVRCRPDHVNAHCPQALAQ